MKQLRKDDGYVLVYVLIVFTVLALVAGSICTMALNNLKAQKADVARMEARYEAEGYLQQFIAEVGTISSAERLDSLEGEFGVKAAVEGELSWTATEDVPVTATVSAWNVDDEGVSADLHSDENTVDVKVTAQDDKELPVAEIQVTLRVTVTVEEHQVEVSADDPLTPDIEETETVTKYTYTASGVTYESYDISYQSADSAEEVPDEA